MKQRTVYTPFGSLVLTEEDDAIVGVRWGHAPQEDASPLLYCAEAQLRAYAAGELSVFDLPLRIKGAAFQRAICDAIAAIPYGHTRTYGEIARDLGASAQAVGRACGGNPIPILIPCHRVMGAKGLTGFSGGDGVDTKVALLRLEGAAGLLI